MLQLWVGCTDHLPPDPTYQSWLTLLEDVVDLDGDVETEAVVAEVPAVVAARTRRRSGEQPYHL